MKLRSHGPNSSLLEHLREVCAAAGSIEERIICACHDAGKATSEWQRYIAGKIPESPHNHAASGGLLACLLIRSCNFENAKFWSLVALHSGAAHHSFLAISRQNKDEFCAIADDADAKAFFLDSVEGIPSLLPDIHADKFQDAWQMFNKLAPVCGKDVIEFNKWISLPPEERLRAFLAARSILGRMCYQDHLSAAKQSGRASTMPSWQQAYPHINFISRPPKIFSSSEKTICQLRSELKTEFHKCLAADSFFYFIDAPTGLGKTETMLSAAEILREKHALDRIVFSVPQVSIADQIYEEYFADKDNVQIWNYIRQEKKAENIMPDDNLNSAFSLDIAMHPFSESYNITTFNQVLLAMCHPHRARCIKGIGLKDAVIIMDEFHKLPMTILPYFFRIAWEYAKSCNCRFIFGSATPLEEFEYLGLARSGRIPAAITGNIYKSQTVDDRRYYHNIGGLSIADLKQRIDVFHNQSKDKSLLLVLNLVGKGTWPLLQEFHGNYNPWRQLELLQRPDNSRITVFLDGLVPPMLRRQIVTSCKIAMRQRPVTLITTQMIEVGVDLDFDHAMIDYQGIAATIQRGGRVGREGRAQPCDVEVFSLLTEQAKKSFEALCDVQIKNDNRMNDIRFQDISRKLQKFWNKEIRFFEQWGERILKDSDLIAGLLEIQNKIFSGTVPDGMLDYFFAEAMGSGELGVDFLAGQYIAELFVSEWGTELLILEDQAALECLTSLVQQLRNGTASAVELKTLNKFIVDRKITVSNDMINCLGLNPAGIIEHLDNLRCMMAAS